MQDARLRVDVSSLQRKPLLGAEPGAGDEDRKRAALGRELVGQALELLPGAEGRSLAALRLRVRDELRDVLARQLRPHGVREHMS